MFKKLFNLSDNGAVSLKRAIIACVLTDLAMMLPFIIIIQSVIQILTPLTGGGAVNTTALWLLFGGGLLAAAAYWFASRNEYDKCYLAAYQEAENTRVEVAERMRKLPMSFFSRKDLAELSTNIMGDCAVIEHTISHVLPMVLGHIISITLVCLMMALYDWRMALAVYCTLPIAALVIILSRKMQARFSEKLISAKLEAATQVQEYLEGIKVIKAFGLEGSKYTRLENAFRQFRNKSIQFEAIAGLFIASASIILQMGLGVVIYAGVYMLTGGTLAVVQFIAFIIIAIRIYSPLIVIMQLLGELFHMMISTRRMRELSKEPIMGGDCHTVPDGDGIRMEDITFAYNDENVIDKVSIDIPQSSVVALVGPSGSGKSTLTRLIARFWDVNSGSLYLGGRNVKRMQPETIMNHISFVFQDVVLFNDTVYNNIKIGNPNATPDEVKAAAAAARCHGFITELPQGYETIIGENGCTLSGGERQRISIARAILKKAPMVLLDEATASLDPENEAEVQHALSALIKGKTVIVIAHRLRTITGVDKIFVMDAGRVSECGTHEELLEAGGLYARLYRTQQQSAGWTF